MTQIKVFRAFREVRKSRNENSLSLLENFHARKGFPLPPQFRSREIRGRKTRTSGKTAREYPASTRNILSVADPRKHHPRGRSAKNSAKLESAEADPIRGGWTRRGWGGGRGRKNHEDVSLQWYRWHGFNEKATTDFTTVSARPIIGSLRNWYTRVPVVNQGFDSRPRFLRIKERRVNVFSLVATINSYGYNARVQQRPLPPIVFFSRITRERSLLPFTGLSLRDEISFRSILNNSEREDSISFARTIYFDRSISFECIILREGRWDLSLGTMEDESRKWMMKTWSLTNL